MSDTDKTVKKEDEPEPEFIEFDEQVEAEIFEDEDIPEELSLEEQIHLIKSKKCRVACRVNETVKVADDRLIVCKGLIIANKPLVKCTKWKKIENKDGIKKWEREK